MPNLIRSEVIGAFNSESPQVVIQESYEKGEESEPEAIEYINKLVEMILKTTSFRLINNASVDLGFEEDSVRKYLVWVIQSC